MRSQWNFPFESNDLRIEGRHKFGGELTRTNSETSPPTVDKLWVEIILESDLTPRFPEAQQTGVLKITLPGNMDETQDAAYWLAINWAEHITFSQGELKLDGSLIMVEYLPESAEEVELLGDNRFSYTVQVRAAEPLKAFDPNLFPPDSELKAISPLQQFNSAVQANNSIDQFLGLFKIIEDSYVPSGERRPLALVLKSSGELLSLALENLEVSEHTEIRSASEAECLRLLDDLARTRNQCAHLRKGFGIPHGDSRVAIEVEPLIGPLKILARAIVQYRLAGKTAE